VSLSIPDYSSLMPADQCLVHRYLYYVLCRPVLDDRTYDMLERDATQDPRTPFEHPIMRPGSDLESSYPDWAQVLAFQMLHPELT
jgi:hypothetical protein